MRRRQFIKVIADSAAAAWPFAARAQQPERIRRIGVLMSLAEHDPEEELRYAAFVQGLQQLGWTDGRNVRIDIRWAAGNANDAHKFAAELIALAPDVILVSGGSSVAPVVQTTRTVPIVFTQTPDPVGAGFVDSLAQGIGQFAAVQSMAPSLGIEVSPVNVGDTGEIERAVAAFARGSNCGLIVTGSGFAILNRKLIATLAARYKLPAIYPLRIFATVGGLIAYGADAIEPHQRAAAYVDRILKGEKPADLPVQAPTKFELVINLKAAKALGLTVPPSLLATANEVIE
jgi:ABC-type uncharacterized transport system substrate-binding protein